MECGLLLKLLPPRVVLFRASPILLGHIPIPAFQIAMLLSAHGIVLMLLRQFALPFGQTCRRQLNTDQWAAIEN